MVPTLHNGNDITSSPPPALLKYLTKQCSVAALYVLLSQIAVLGFHNGTVNIIWPAGGLALAVLLIGGKKYAWGLFAGALVSTLILTMPLGGFPWREAIACTSSDILVALLSAWLIARDNRFDRSMHTFRDYLRLILLAAGIAGCIAVLTGAATVMRGALAGKPPSLNLVHWWMSESLGILLITPLILAWWQTRNDKLELRRVAEYGLLLGAVLFAGQIVFFGWFHNNLGHVADSYWMFLIIFCVAARLGPSGAATALVITAIQALISVSAVTGPFAGNTLSNSLNDYWIFMTILSLTGMSQATYIHERKRTGRALFETDALLQNITRNFPCVMFRAVGTPREQQFKFTYVGEHFSALYGLKLETMMSDPESLFRSVHADDAAEFDLGRRRSAENLEPWKWKGRIVTCHDGEKWVSLRATPHRRGDGMIVFNGVMLHIPENSEIAIKLEESCRNLRELAAAYATALEEEKKRIAREVHDELGQTLTALRMNASLLRIQFGDDNPLLTNKIQGITRLVDRAIQGVRNVTANLRPAVLDMGIVSAIQWLSKEFTRCTAIPCILDIESEEMDLGETCAVAVFRIVQESLTNIARHAEADSAKISMAREGNKLLVKVRDSGKGFDLHAQSAIRSFGLLGMRERVIALGGVFDIASTQGHGTAVTVCIPISPD